MRRSRRFIPSGWDPLEIRLTLSQLAMVVRPGLAGRGEIGIAVPRGSALRRARPAGPIEALNREFDAFRADVQTTANVLAATAVSAQATELSTRAVEPGEPGTEPYAERLAAYINTRVQILATNLAGAVRSRSTPTAVPAPTSRTGTSGARRLNLGSMAETIALDSSARLRQGVMSIPLPDGPNPDLAQYDAALDLAIEPVRTEALLKVRALSPTPRRG